MTDTPPPYTTTNGPLSEESKAAFDPPPDGDEVQRWAAILKDADWRRETAESVQMGSSEPWEVQMPRAVVAELSRRQLAADLASTHTMTTDEAGAAIVAGARVGGPWSDEDRAAATELAKRAGFGGYSEPEAHDCGGAP